MFTDDEDNEREESRCPYCGRADTCPHVLLLIDRTFQEAEGGILKDAFRARWDGEESDLVDLLGEVDALADGFDRYNFEGVPGQSSTYEVYYVATVAKGKKALASFSAGAGRS